MKRTVIFISAVLIIVVLMISQLPVHQSKKYVRYDQLDIGQGDSAVIQTPDNIVIVIDAGSGSQIIDAVANVLPWNERHINYLLLTHPDLDHYGGARWLIERYSIGEIWFNGDRSKTSMAYQELLQTIERKHITLRAVHQGDQLRLSSGIRWNVLWPPNNYQAPSSNGGCVVSKISWGQEDILLPCDLPSEQELLLVKNQNLEAEILKAGHHGSKYSSSSIFLDAVHPHWCLISAGRDNRYGHPNIAAVRRLEKTGCQLLSTIDRGTLSFQLSSTSIDYNSSSSAIFFDLPRQFFLAILKTLHH